MTMMDDPNLLVVGAVSFLALLIGAYFLFGKSKKPTVLPLDDFKPFPLIRKDVLSHDTARFVFGLPEGHVLGLPTGQHISLRFFDKSDGGKQVMRSYTPTSDNSSVGEVSLVIKVYKAGVHPKFPDGGKMSQHLDSLKIGDTIDIKGPKGHMEYLGNGGKFWVKPIGKPKSDRQSTQYIMIAGGTGITPILQVLNYMFRNPGTDSQVKVNLLYANQTEDDILVRDELEGLAKEFPDRFKLHYTLDRPPKVWAYSAGFISKEMLQEYMLFNGSSKDTQVFMCGPPPMIKFACLPNLTELGFTEKQWFSF